MNSQKIYTGIVSFVMLLLVTGISGCYKDNEEFLYPGSNQVIDCTTTPAKFTVDVLPIISAKCAISGCHDATASGGMIFQSYSQISAAKDRINARAIVEKSMPASGILLTTEIAKIKCWIDGGGLNN